MKKLYYYIRYAWNYLYFLTHSKHRAICESQLKAQQDFVLRHELDQIKTYHSNAMPIWRKPTCSKIIEGQCEK